MSAAESFLTIGPPANPGGSSTAVLWDSTYGLLGTPVLNTQGPYRRASWANHYKRATVTIFADQIVTLFARTLASGSTSWRTYNGTGAGEATTASTFFERDIFLMGDDVQLYISTGTVPTTWEVSIKLRATAELVQ
jgi:hypothetical protein